jgi:hypothetical protein
MKPISRKAIRKYFADVLLKKTVVTEIDDYGYRHHNQAKMLQDYMPDLVIDNLIKGYGGRAAGYTMGVTQVHIAQWILADESEAKGVVRHEVAHLVQHYEHGQCRTHGKEFTKALKLVSPTNWRNDRYWHDTPIICKAREECEANPNKIYLT